MPQDHFGVRKIFEDARDGSSYYQDPTNPYDNQIDVNGRIDAYQTYWDCHHNPELSPPSFRLHVFPQGDNIDTVATPDHSIAHENGYMASPRDFRNVEFTAYFKILSYMKNASLDEDYLSVYTRGGVKTNASYGCAGCGYRAGIEYDGGWHCTKYFQYPSNYYINPTESFKFFNSRPSNNLINRWIGMKVLVYDIPPKGKVSYTSQTADVCIEVLYDWLATGSEPATPTNNWTRYFQIFDRGANTMGHGGNKKQCNARNIYEILQWGAPLVTLRIDNVSSVLIKWLSVREIDTQRTVDIGTDPPAIPSEALIYDLYPPPNPTSGISWSRLGIVWNDAYTATDRCFGGPGPGTAVVTGGQGPEVPICEDGFHYDPAARMCVPDEPGMGKPGGDFAGQTPTGPGKVYDQWGVQKIYPDKVGETQYYINMDNPYSDGKFNVSYGTGSQYKITRMTDPNGMIYYNTRGEVVTYASGGPKGRSQRLDVYPDGGKWANKTKFSWDQKPDYLYTAKGIRNGEFTSYIRGKQDLGSNVHHAWAHKCNGRDEDSIRSLWELVRPTVTGNVIKFNWNYAHSPYVGKSPTIKKMPESAKTGKWYGTKTVHKVAADKKSAICEIWCDDDAIDATTGRPKNNWYLAATVKDEGVKDYKNIPCTWRCHKDVVRIDGWDSCDFAWISDREIDPDAIPGQWDAGAGTTTGLVAGAPPAHARQPTNGVWAIINGQKDTTEASALQYGMLVAHELVESITDPQYRIRQGWCIAGGDEIGDVCINTSGTYGTGADKLLVEGYYSNSDGGCTVPGIITKTGGSKNLVIDGGGAIIPNCVVYMIYWGVTWTNETPLINLRKLIDHKVKDLLLNINKNYWSKTSQYSSIQPPTWGGSIAETTVWLPDPAVSDSATISFIKECIRKGLVPAPNQMNWQVFYCVILKPGRYQQGFKNLTNAFHDIFTYP